MAIKQDLHNVKRLSDALSMLVDRTDADGVG